MSNYQNYYGNQRPKQQLGMIEILIIINIVAFLLYYFIFRYNDSFIVKYLFMNINRHLPLLSINQQAYWQFLTSMFIHGDFSHIFFNMYALYIFGKPLELRWGKGRFLSYYLTSGILANIATFAIYYYTQKPVSVIGASGAVFAILLAFASFYPDATLLLFFVIPVKTKFVILLYAGIELFSMFFARHTGISHVTHVFGLVSGFLYLLLIFKTNAITKMFGKKEYEIYDENDHRKQ